MVVMLVEQNMASTVGKRLNTTSTVIGGGAVLSLQLL
jgi:Na+/citrate or Na+/malate symporter